MWPRNVGSPCGRFRRGLGGEGGYEEVMRQYEEVMRQHEGFLRR